MPRRSGNIRVFLWFWFILLATPISGNSSSALGTVASAERAQIGTAAASVGTAVFAGDTLSTGQTGSLQIRAGAARLLLGGSSLVVLGTDAGVPSATLGAGTAAFSTATAKAFVLHAATAVFRPQGDEATVASVTLINPKDLVMRCSRGALLIQVDDDIRVISAGTAYHVVLDPEVAARAGSVPAPAQAPWGRNKPIKAGTNRFVWYAIAFTAIVTGFAVSEALESPNRP